jgi:hypothetical protein
VSKKRLTICSLRFSTSDIDVLRNHKTAGHYTPIALRDPIGLAPEAEALKSTGPGTDSGYDEAPVTPRSVP